MMTTLVSPAYRAFLLGGESREVDAPLFPRFFARLSLRAADQLQQTTSSPVEIDIIAGRKFFRLRHKTRGIARVENQSPFEMFLARQDEGDGLVMRVDQQQKGVVMYWFALELEHIRRIATQQHAETAHERRRPFFLCHPVAAGIEPHHIPNLRAGDAATFSALRTPQSRMLFSELYQVSRHLTPLIHFFVTPPVEPSDIVTLSISAVVAVLC